MIIPITSWYHALVLSMIKTSSVNPEKYWSGIIDDGEVSSESASAPATVISATASVRTCDTWFTFILHYWTTTKLHLYRNYAKSTYTPTITTNATGGIVQKPTLMSGRITVNIFLYEIGVREHTTNNCQFAVFHMLSERQDYNSISHWLGEWKKSEISPPKIIVTDQSLTRMMVIVKKFTKFWTIEKYIEVCSSLMNKKSNDDPTCMLRNDFNHIMHLVSSWFNNQSTTRIKHFYLRSIGSISTDNEYIKKIFLRYL